nr:pectinesterase 31 [Ipomoea batatas]GMD93622.1 pectinesterase 31 [Ipomoea batatas]
MSAMVMTVAQDGSGDFLTVQEAIDVVPFGNTRRTVIRVAPGIYTQPIYIPKTKNLITLAGLSPEATVLTWNNTATNIDHHQPSRIIGTGTFGCGSIIVEGEDFIAENVTFENSAPECAPKQFEQGSGQAVAIRVTADRCAFYNSRFLGWQDTLYLHYGKQYLKDCYIEGSVDFIFGNSTALLEHCHIHCKSAGFITAQSRKSSQETTGYVFLRCVITGNGGTFYTHLGRPWGPFGRVVFAHTYMDSCIKEVGWHNWGKTENERTACFYEYRCFGPGSCPAKRATWGRELLEEEAEEFLLHGFIDPDPERPWLARRMGLRVPYSA